MGDDVHDDRASAEELTALRAAVLQSHEEFLCSLPGPRTTRMWDGLHRLHMSWLVIPWILLDGVRMFVSSLRRGFPIGDKQAVALYRRLSGKDPHVARAEVTRIVLQLGKLDERLRDLDQDRRGAPRGASSDELAAAAGALLGYYLAGRRTDDELLDEVEAAWVKFEELTQQGLEQAGDHKHGGRDRADPSVEDRVTTAADRYRAAWRCWFDRQAEHGPAT